MVIWASFRTLRCLVTFYVQEWDQITYFVIINDRKAFLDLFALCENIQFIHKTKVKTRFNINLAFRQFRKKKGQDNYYCPEIGPFNGKQQDLFKILIIIQDVFFFI